MSNSQSLPGNRSLRFSLLAALFLSIGFFVVFTWSPSTRATLNGSKAPASGDSKRARPAYVPGDVLVRYRSDAVAKKRQLATTLSTASGRTIAMRVEHFEGSDVIDGLRIARVAPEETLNAIVALKSQPDVAYAEPNYVVHMTVTPNDTSYGSLYAMTKIGAPTAWNTTTGSSNIVVADIDQGVDVTHPDLQANIWTNPFPGSISGIAGDLHGYDFLSNSGTISADFHATHTAGTIGAVGNNGAGVVGVNWSVKLMSLKFIGGPLDQGSDADAIRACSYVKQMKDLWVSSGGTHGANVRVTNNSYGSPIFSFAFRDMLYALNQSGILFVAAAGNDGELDNDATGFYPASYNVPNVIAVAATDQNDALASFSHYGAKTVTLGAPGVGILSTTPSNGYTFQNGTSMAAPHVAGAAALLLAQNPNLTVAQLKCLLMFNGDAVASLAGKTFSGRRLNIGSSFAALASNDTTPPGMVTGFHVNSQSGRSVDLGWTASGGNGSSGQAALYQLSFTDAVTGEVVQLQNFAPPTSGTPQTFTAKVPYGHTSGTIALREFDSVGNEGPLASLNVPISFVEGNPYASTVGEAVALSTGGTPLGLSLDDAYRQNYPLPFAFPFYGQNVSTVTIATNGNLYFSTPPLRSNGDADDSISAVADLFNFKMIAGMWDDLDLRTSRRAGADVYVLTPDASRIIFRWQGVQFGDGTIGDPINFEIELNANGTIKTRYGSGNTNLLPVVGISNGEGDPYVISGLTSEELAINLTNAQQVTYIPRGVINPDDNVDFFVSQHYRDFLAREPDPGGEAFWIDQIAGNAGNQPAPCANGDVNCVNTRRINVSNAFFFELEYQQTGSYVYRMYREAYGNNQPSPNPDGSNLTESKKIPLYSNFKADREQVIGGASLAQQQLAFANVFVQRPEFIAKYPANLTLDQFVDAVLLTIQNDIGVNLTSQRTALINLGSRGAVIYRLADDNAGTNPINNRPFIDAEYNRAFVFGEYSGYLKRDSDIFGFLFWLGQVNSGPLRDTTKQRAMVCSFIDSQEYQFRFSTIESHHTSECQ
jgi:subtilisin family serine protease